MRGKHPNSQANLQPFEKGQSGNPSGRTKAYSGIKDELKEYVEQQYLNAGNDDSKGFIFSEGNIGSDLMIIGDNPETLDINNIKSFLNSEITNVKIPGDFNQAMMDLGRIICKPKIPDCLNCPLNSE